MALRRLIAGLLLTLALCIANAGELAAQGGVQGPFNFTNRTIFFANDFHAVFTGTGGTLRNPRMTKGSPGAIITAGGNTVDIVFPIPVPPGGQIGFVVQSRFPIKFNSGYFTWFGIPIGAANIDQGEKKSLKPKKKKSKRRG